ncbi:hypothetical protein FOCC_FOCC015631 [Frankliniella occidentalis]|nr:hypothetical protein FOCC_FOCC015631 [Frankliniella occidentalis]
MLRLFVTERFSPSTDELYEDAKDPLFLGEATAHRETGSTDDSDGKEHVDADHGQGLWRWTSEDETRKLSQIGAKLLKCKVCFKTFNDEIQLNMHMRYHPREQTFSCYVCEKDFKSIFDLSSHIKCHTGKKHFKCGDCGMTFTFKANLTKHMNKHKKLFQGVGAELEAAKVEYILDLILKDCADWQRFVGIGGDRRGLA